MSIRLQIRKLHHEYSTCCTCPILIYGQWFGLPHCGLKLNLSSKVRVTVANRNLIAAMAVFYYVSTPIVAGGITLLVVCPSICPILVNAISQERFESNSRWHTYNVLQKHLFGHYSTSYLRNRRGDYDHIYFWSYTEMVTLILCAHLETVLIV